MRNFLFVMALVAVIAAPVRAGVLVSNFDILSDPNDVFLRTFNYDPAIDGGLLNIQTWGYGGTAGAPGGRNLAGIVVPAGGFDPIVTLFFGTGASATRLAYNDDGSCPPGTPSPVCYDATLNLTGLSAGEYTLALTAYSNFPAGSTLGDGWTGGGSFTDFGGRPRTQFYAVDVQAIPEPLTFGLIGGGLLLLGLMRRRRLAARWS